MADVFSLGRADEVGSSTLHPTPPMPVIRFECGH